jgi:hypothetical protein
MIEDYRDGTKILGVNRRSHPAIDEVTGQDFELQLYSFTRIGVSTASC